jgi:hypothetical protein
MNAALQHAPLLLIGDRNQCPTCGEYFNRTSGFDRHRIGKIGTPTRRCLTAAEMQAEGWTKSKAGFWLVPRNGAGPRIRRAESARLAPPSGSGHILSANMPFAHPSTRETDVFQEGPLPPYLDREKKPVLALSQAARLEGHDHVS